MTIKYDWELYKVRNMKKVDSLVDVTGADYGSLGLVYIGYQQAQQGAANRTNIINKLVASGAL